ncbi:hypothetical protein Pint_31628 [Pistacia integerrima]|uniref:Uncharacterized protein n=1 Tax=Pistacia integerrima TaxID=434235 RepID=A0ACC0XNW6_9ROSI|nr:hypothetical protein Pint_31628 [Pistacia integerrima]
MGASSSRIEEDKVLQLCRERKKFVRQALDGRCSLAGAHIAYVQSLRNTGTALRKFVEPEGPIESSLYTSTNATPEPLAFTEKSLSQFSFSSPTFSQRVDATENLCPSPSPPPSSQFQASHMKFRGISSKKVEEKPPSPVIGTLTSSSTPQNSKPHYTEKQESSLFEESAIPSVTPPWDYFGPLHPIDHQFSFKEGKGMNQGFENVDDLRKPSEEEGIPELEDEEGNASFRGREESLDSEDEFDEPSADTLVRRFENFNRLNDHNAPSASPTMPSAGSVASESEFMNGEKSNSPDLSPVRATSSRAALPSIIKKTPVKEDCIENKVTPKDFLSSMKDIEHLFIKASESGKEVPRMLEANKLHFRPILPAKESGSMASTFFKTCFSCGEEHSEVQEEPAQNSVKYLTWHRTESSRSSSSRTPLGLNSKDEVEDLTSNVFDSIHMISSSHASTLDRLYAWERKLYDEVKASEMVRRVYDSKCKILRQLESKGESPTRIDKTRAVVKDLHSRIRVAIHRIESISKRIEELRDTELQPQLEELIEGLSRMWEVMYECHKLQFHIISVAFNNGNSKISIQSDSHRQITIHLESELSSLSSSFTKWIEAQSSYLKAIKSWLYKCVYLRQKYSRRKRPLPAPPLRNYGPPIYATCDVWLEKLDELHREHVTNSIKNLAAETIRFLPRQDKNQGKSTTRLSTSWNAENGSDPAINIMTDEASEEWISGFDRFRSSLVRFIGQLNNFAKDSVDKYVELLQAIKDAKNNYAEMINRDAKSNADQVRSNNGQLPSQS